MFARVHLRLTRVKAGLPNWLLILLLIIFIFRIPSLFEPYWYGDEAIYLTVGQQLSQGALLYRDIYDNKPPLIYILTAVAGNLFWFKAILTFWSLATIILFFNLVKLIFTRAEKLIRYATIAFALLTTLPLLEGNIANAENFLILTTILAFLILLKKDNPSPARIFSSGLILGIGVLFKAPALVDAFVPVVLLFAAFSTSKDSFQGFLKKSSVFILAAISPFVLTVVIFYLAGIGNLYVSTTLTQMIGYLSSWQGIPQTNLTGNQPLLLRAGLIIIFLFAFVALYRKEKISRGFLFVGAWFFLSIFAMLLSERPYPHYILQVVPSLSILLGLAIAARGRQQFWTYPLFLALGAAMVFYKFQYYPVFSYYTNFVKLASGQQTQTQFFANFDARTPKNYQTAKFLHETANENDRLFIWGNDPEIYALSRVKPATSYTVAYHIKDLNKQNQVMDILKNSPPRFIIATEKLSTLPELSIFVSENYTKVINENTVPVFLLTR